MILVDGKCYCKSGPMNRQGKCGVCPKGTFWSSTEGRCIPCEKGCA